MPTASCNDDGSEDFAGIAEGLDNDGDGPYDGDDGDCNATSTPDLSLALASLSQNVPNPFNPQTSISYRMLAPGWAQIRVFDAKGRIVRVLVGTHHGEAGDYTVRWDGRDSKGRALSSGVYFYSLDALGVSQIRKAVLVR
jgi:hypothetical protein